jgi:hypothetical protein
VAIWAIREIIGYINASGLTTNVATVSAFVPAVWHLARILISERAKVNTPKNKKNAPAAEPGNKRRKRTRDKLIRLDDLIPEKDVKGGHQVLFGVTERTQSNEKGK